MRNTCRDGLIAANAEAIAMYIQSLLAFAAQTRSTVKAMFSNRDRRRSLVRQEAVVAQISRHTAFRSSECVRATLGRCGVASWGEIHAGRISEPFQCSNSSETLLRVNRRFIDWCGSSVNIFIYIYAYMFFFLCHMLHFWRIFFETKEKTSNLEAMIISCFFLEEQTFRDFHLVCRVWKTTLQVMQPPGTIVLEAGIYYETWSFELA